MDWKDHPDCPDHPGKPMTTCTDHDSPTGRSWMCLKCMKKKGDAPASTGPQWESMSIGDGDEEDD